MAKAFDQTRFGADVTGDVETVRLELVADVTVEGAAVTPGTDRSIALVVDKPPTLGGTDRGPMPSEYLLAAVGSCNMMTARRIAAKRGVPYETMRCEADAHLAGADITKVVLRFAIITTADEAAWDTVLRLADRTCTVSRALSCPVERTLSVIAPNEG